jgi:hypothetical protein
VLHDPSLYFRLNPLTLAVTPLAVKVRIFPGVPDRAEFPFRLKVPGTHVGGGVGVGVGVGAGVGAGVGVGVGVWAGVAVAVGVGVGVGVGV